MRPAEGLKLDRTVGDTDPLLLELVLRTGASTYEPVPDSATVKMHLKLNPVVTLAGIGDGSGAGLFSFDTAVISGVAAPRVGFEVQVTDGDAEYTIGSGVLLQRAQIS